MMDVLQFMSPTVLSVFDRAFARSLSWSAVLAVHYLSTTMPYCDFVSINCVLYYIVRSGIMRTE